MSVFEQRWRMYNIERQEEIIRILGEKHSASVRSLAQLLFTSESTIRRDLEALERSGRLRRTFGGAVLEETQTKEVPLYLRRSMNEGSKRLIAERASALAKNGDVIFLDASSTVAHLVPYLKLLKNITVVTNSPNTSLELGRNGVSNYCTGGRLLEYSEAYVGSDAESFVKRFNADVMFFSSRGISEDGFITDSSVEESQIRRAMMSRSSRKFYLYDDSKFGKKYLFNICSVEDIDGTVGETERF